MSTIRKIKILGENVKENFYCTLCTYPIMTGEDFSSSKDYGVCYSCYQHFIEGKIDEWKKGNRPEKTVLADYILIKNKLNQRR